MIPFKFPTWELIVLGVAIAALPFVLLGMVICEWLRQ